jgi:hypothetical protein
MKGAFCCYGEFLDFVSIFCLLDTPDANQKPFFLFGTSRAIVLVLPIFCAVLGLFAPICHQAFRSPTPSIYFFVLGMPV